jgi:hypothetical protein
MDVLKLGMLMINTCMCDLYACPIKPFDSSLVSEHSTARTCSKPCSQLYTSAVLCSTVLPGTTTDAMVECTW